ncbi:MAG: peptidylprolyl isomerase [Gemmatimonadota bacterium]|jgi:parvulin-like peptidyl-prolyl isomerase
MSFRRYIPWTRGAAVAVALTLGLTAPATAQGVAGEANPFGNDSTLVDRVVALVGDSVITMTEVIAEYRVAQQSGQEVTPRRVLDELVNVQLMLQAAARDSTLEVPTDELDERVEDAVEQVRGRFPDDRTYQQALEQQGLTPQEYRQQLRERIRVEQLQQMFIRKHLASTPAVAVTEEEMRDFYEARRTTLQERPELLTLQQVFVEPTASDSAWAAAEAEADSLRALLAEGADFAEMAKENSDDPASATEGGDMGWFRRGVMVREFEQAAFNLRDGQISQPVRTRFGYHLIKVEKQRPGEVKARHILVRPAVSADDDARAAGRAEEVARRAREGEPMDSIRPEFGDVELPAEIQVARDQLGDLPYDAASALANVSEGDVVGPLEANLGGQSYRVVVRVSEVREAGEFTFEDLRDQIRQQLSQRKRVERIYEQLRDRMYVEIRM